MRQYDPIEREEIMELLGKVRYFNVPSWTEHTIDLNINLCESLYGFIEEATRSYSSCLIVSVNNTCATVVVACVYLLLKYKWSIQNSIQYIHSRKPNIQLTKPVLEQMRKIEEIYRKRLTLISESIKIREDWSIPKEISNPLEDKLLSK